MPARVPRVIALSSVGFFAIALFAGDAFAQGSRGTTGKSRTGSLRGNAQNGGSQQRLPFSSGVSTGQPSGFGQPGGFGDVTASGAGVRGGGQGMTAQGPMSAGLAQTAGERFQEGGFVGRDAEDVRTSFDSQSGGRGPGGMMDMMIENLNEMRDARRRWREQNSQPPAIRVRLQPAFDVPVLPAGQANLEIQSRLTRVMELRGVGSPQVELAGRTAVLRGTVATARDRALVERIASLEPGVSRVENLVRIQAPLVQPAPLPPQ
jgi:hypothetical protein